MRGNGARAVSGFILNQTIVVGYSDGLIWFWDLSFGTVSNSFDAKCSIIDVTLFNDKLLVGCTLKPSRVIDLFTGDLVLVFETDGAFYVYQDLVYVFNGQYAVDTICYNKNFSISAVYDIYATAVLRRGNLLFLVSEKDSQITMISISNGTTSLFTGLDHSAAVWNLLLGGNYLISGGFDNRIVLWDIYRKSQIRLVDCNPSVVNYMLLYNSSSLLFSDTSGAVILCDFVADKRRATFGGKSNDLTSLAVYGDYLISGGFSVEVKRWSISNKQLLPSFTNNTFTGQKCIFCLICFLLAMILLYSGI